MEARVFKEYDVRGLYGTELREEDAERIGLAWGTFLRAHGDRTIVLGRDARLHSPVLEGRLRAGLHSTGITTVDLGMVSSPMSYFAVGEFGTDGGTMVTASHNPAEWNGFKFRRKSPVYGGEIQEIRALAEGGRFARGTGRSRPGTGVFTAYVDAVVRGVRLARPLRVVLDAGNGAAGPVAVSVFERLGCRVDALYCDPDGRFPNHHPDPIVPGNLEALRARVLETGAEIGFAYDGDGDRLSVVDEEGGIHWADRILLLLLPSALARRPGGAVLCDVKCSMLVEEETRRLGGIPVMCKTGYPFLLRGMREHQAVLGAELSGHMYFHDPVFGFDDGVYASAKVAEAIAADGARVSERFGALPSTFGSPEIRCECPDDRKVGVTEALARRFGEGRRVIGIDGARVVYPDGWGLVRASNTQPSLVLVFEGRTRQALERIQEDFRRALREHPEVTVGF